MRQTIALIFSVVLGLIAVFAMRSYIQNQRKAVTKGMDLIEIAVAKRPLSSGTKISLDIFKARKIPVSFYINDMIKMDEISAYRGKSVGRYIARNKLILKTDIVKTNIKISRLLAIGERLVTVSVSNTSGVAGLIKPHARVDVFYATQGNGDINLLLSNVLVYAVDNRVDSKALRNGRSGYSSLTLVGTPNEVALLMAAESNGKLIFTLRNEHDTAIIDNIQTVNAKNLLSRAKLLNANRVSNGVK